MTGQQRLASALLFITLCATAAAQFCPTSRTNLSPGVWKFGSANSNQKFRVPSSDTDQYVVFVPTEPSASWSGSRITFLNGECPSVSDPSCDTGLYCTSSVNNMFSTFVLANRGAFNIFVSNPSVDYGVTICSSSDCSNDCVSSCGLYEFCNATTALCECSYLYSYSPTSPSCAGSDTSTFPGGSFAVFMVLVIVIPIGILCCLGLCIAVTVVLVIRRKKSKKHCGVVLVAPPPDVMIPIQQAYPVQAGYPPMQYQPQQDGYPPMQRPDSLSRDNAAYPAMQQPDYLLQENTAFPVMQQPDHLLQENTAFPAMQQPDHLLQENPAFPPMQQPDYLTQENPAYPPQQQTGYPPQQQTDYPLDDPPPPYSLH